MSYGSEPIYFMVRLDGLLPGLLQRVHQPRSPEGRGELLPPQGHRQKIKRQAGGWAVAPCTVCRGSRRAFCLLQIHP